MLLLFVDSFTSPRLLDLAPFCWFKNLVGPLYYAIQVVFNVEKVKTRMWSQGGKHICQIHWIHNSFWVFNALFKLLTLYSLIWDFLLSQINICTTTIWSNVWVVLPKPSWCEFLIGFLIWTPASSICILQHSPISMWFYPCSCICNCLKMPKSSKLTNIVIFVTCHVTPSVVLHIKEFVTMCDFEC